MSSSRPIKRRAVVHHTTTKPVSHPRLVSTVAQRAAARPQVVKAAAMQTPAEKTSQSVAVKDASTATKVAELREKARRTRLQFLDSLESIQPRQQNVSKRPRWFKIATWAVMLMPVYAIIIYIIGFFYFLPSEVGNVGLQTSFSITPTTTIDHILIPDQEGVFLQNGTPAKQGLALIQEIDSRTLQPPPDATMTLSAAALTRVLIRQANVFTPDQYQLFIIKDGAADTLVNTVATRVPSPGIALISLTMPAGKTWAPGEYMVVAPEAGLDEGTLYYFFSIK